MKSRFKHLVVSGCSFTSNLPAPGNEPYQWPNLIANWTGMDIHNLAIPGAGNGHISKSIILYLEKNKLSPKDTLVLVMWSGAGRIDWITDASLSNFKTQYPFSYAYDEYNELALGGHWWNTVNPTHLMKTMQEYSKYQSDHSFALRTWLAMENLSNYLTVNNFAYYYTSFVNYKTNHIKGDALLVTFFDELKKLNLTLDTEHWLDLADDDYYGDWARKNKMLNPVDDFHPSGDSVEIWPREVLMPLLKNMGILYE